MSEEALLQTERQDETPPPEQQPPQQPAPVDDDAALDAELEAQAIAVPDGEKLVPLSAVTGVRGKLKDAKSAAAAAKAEAETAKGQAAQYAQWIEQAKPYIDAARALAESRGQQPQQPQQVAPQDDPELVELARTLDLYDASGKPDAGKAKALASFFDKRAGKAAKDEVAPYAQSTVQREANINLARAKATAVNGVKADPAILDALWSRTDPSVAANPEAAKWLLTTAIGLTTLGGQQQPPAQQQGHQRGADGKFQPQQPSDPLYTEKAGGRVDVTPTHLSDNEKKIARELYPDAKDPVAAYVKDANTMPKGWGKGR